MTGRGHAAERRRVRGAALGAALLLASIGAAAQRTTLVRASVDGGGGRATGGQYVVTGTFAQADASRTMSGAHVMVAGGFWPDLRPDALFEDGFEDP